MRLSKYFYLPLLIVAGLAFTACDDDDDYTQGKPTAADCPALTFGSDNSASEEIEPTEPTSYDITIYRNNATEAATYSIIVLTNTDDAFVVPETVSFGAGETATTITVTFEDTEIGKEYSLEISLADDDVDVYAEDAFQTYAFSVTRVKWNALGLCTYTDDFFTTFYGVGQVTWEVEIEERDDLPGYFRLVYPYDEKYIWNDPGDWDTSQTYYLIVDATDPSGVIIPQQEIGVDWGYGMISVWSMADYDIQRNGSTLEEEKSAGNCGTYDEEKGLITFPDNTLLINMPEYSSGWYYANTSGWFMILMPGFALADYSVEIDYQGVNDNGEAVAEITLGEDVDYALVAVVEGTDVDGAASDIKSGSIASQQITTNGTYTFSFTGEGMHVIVAVSYSDGAAQEVGSARFNYETGDPNEGWTSLGIGLYTDDVVASLFGYEEDCLTWEVEIQEKDDQPGLYRLMYPYDGKYPYNDPGDWDTSMDYNIEINACDPDGVFITEQELGIDWGYGMISIWSDADYYMSFGYSLEDVKDAGMCGTLKDGVITFPQYELLTSMANYYGGTLMDANYWGMFKVVLPGASEAKAQKVSATHKTINKGAVKNGKRMNVKGMVKKNTKQVK